MTYYQKIKKLRAVALAKMILSIVLFVLFIVTIITLANSAYSVQDKENTAIAGAFMFSSFIWFLSVVIWIANFVLWIVSMVQAFSLDEYDNRRFPKKDLTLIKVMSVINGFTFNIGLFVVVNGEYKSISEQSDEDKIIVQPKEEKVEEKPIEEKVEEKSTEEKLKKIDDLLKEKIITEEQHSQLKAEILKKN